MDVYVLLDAFDEGVSKKVLGVYSSLDEAYSAAFYILRESEVFEPLELKESTKTKDMWKVVNGYDNVWNYIVKKKLGKVY